MSAPSDSAANPSQCACTNISLMQLFHELKQKFPGVPDHVVSNTIELYCHDKKACENHLLREVKTSLTHAYHGSSLAAARQLNNLKINPPPKCRNQPIVRHDIIRPTNVTSVTCQAPQTALISTSILDDLELSTDNNQNIVEKKPVEAVNSPVAIVNLDNCFVKYNADSPSDLELTNEKQGNITKEANPEHVTEAQQSEITNYRILKSNKIKSNLHERLDCVKEKKTIKKDKEEPKKEVKEESLVESKEEPKLEQQTKPQRPNTLNFIKPNPDIAFNEGLKPQPEAETFHTVSSAPKTESKDNKNSAQRQDRGYPLNLSVNVNCHMDLSRTYSDLWLDDYESPRAITSVNLTVCTPTSNMASPVRDNHDDDNGFEGHVTVTVSPSTARPPRRRAPPPPPTSRIDSPRPARAAPDPPSREQSLIERQKERLARLASALAQEKGRLAQLSKETQILAAPPPTPMATQRLKDYVERLRDECDMLAKTLEMGTTARVLPVPETADGNFYSNIYTGQRPPSSWQCHMCTFRNHPLLDKCEECDMPRIFVVRSPDGITVRLMPGRRKIVRSWVL
ncbi:uncharacterized protein LOC126973866 isoform X2 [Leptidea sinapis]|uniref:uncharacterized protein LOC126973866 isoform X2 n=1 Tax=Leptidea sinapis TaxID=189913 RepID=UPI0021C270F7|nr:uncharacterized protein LOC126973866 isoform X2 [Leptidea sinapis]